MHPHIHCSIIYNIQDLKIAQESIRIGVDKTIVHLQNGILLSHKMKGEEEEEEKMVLNF